MAPPDLPHALTLAALDAVGGGVTLIDARSPDRPVVYANAAYLRTCGVSSTDVVGRAPSWAGGGDVDDQRALAEALRDGLAGVFRVPATRADGSRRWDEIHLSPLRDGDGAVTHLVAVHHEVTEMIEARAEIERLEQAVDVASRAAEEASRTRIAFLANMSHELRTPMNAILGYSEMLVEDLEDSGQDDMVEDLKRIRDAGTHLLGLINDILDLSRIEAGKIELFPEDVRLAELLDAVATTVQPLVARNGNTLSIELPDAPATLRTDASRLRQVLINVVGNAAKFTTDGHIVVRASKRGEGDDEEVEITVQDTGIGMTDEQLARLFQDFSQGDRSSTRRFGGTGLGLSLSQRFCQMMGGSIRVQSAPNEGSTFRITVPAVLSVRDGEITGSRATPAPPPPRGSGPSVLVVDDDPAVRDLVVRLLGREGYQVHVAEDGETGLRLAREVRPALVTLDVMMRGIDGWTVLQRMKADPELRDVPVVMLSICDDPHLGVALGAEGFLVKPVRREALLSAVNRAVRDRGRTVLVVDDDLGARDLVRRTLEREGWAVATATNGHEALLEIARRTPAAIILDLMMPEMDGFEVVAALQRSARWREIPVVVLTARLLDEEDQARLRGAVQHIVGKEGRSPTDLIRELGHVLERVKQVAPIDPVR